MNKEEILNKFTDAKEKLDIIKNNIEYLGVRMALEDAATLRENLCNDQEISIGCNVDQNISQKRKNVLDDIRAFQVEVVTNNIYRESKVDKTHEQQVVDFKNAKSEMSSLIDKELKENLFADYEDAPIFEKIDKCQEHIVSLQRVKRNCDDDKYIVLLMGEYQAGKSTTLDALCDGHHISAIGDGTATSAVLVSVSYAPKEYINIRWKNKEQLTSILNRIKIFLPDFNWTSFDLDDSTSRISLSNAIENLRQSNNCPKIGDGDSKFLMISHFLLNFYSSKELSNKKATLQNVAEISNITRFPKKGDTIWRKSGLSPFRIEEALFVFIDCVECYIPSETLRQLNCTIIDSPGLFNSSYDTMITQQAMIDAHAIMYVLPRHKGIGEDNCNSLYYIKDNYPDVHSKLFIVNNLDSTQENEFFGSNCDTIKAMFGDEKQIYIYDARLSYLLQLKQSYYKGEIKEEEFSHLMTASSKNFMGAETVITFDCFDNSWNFHTDKYRRSNNIDISGTYEQSLYNAGFTSMISTLGKFIAKNKAYAVIVSNGILPLSSELSSIKNSLYLQFIEPYISSFDKIAKKWERRILKANDFQKFMRNLIHEELFGGNGISLLDRVVSDEYRKLFTDEYFQELAEAIAKVLYDNKGILLATKTLFKKDKELFKQHFQALATPLIEKEILDLVSTKILYMRGMVDSNQDSTITNMFKPTIEKIESILENRWREEFEGEKDFLMSNYLSIKKDLSGTWSDSTGNNSYNTEVLTSGLVNLTLIGGLIAQIAVIVTGIASTIAGIVTAIFCDPSGASLAVALGLSLVGVAISAFAPDYVRNQFIKPLAEQIRPKLISEGGVGFKSIVIEQLQYAFNHFANGIYVDINKMKNERDIALTPQENQECLCFNAVDSTVRINNQLKIYDEFRKENIN